MPLQRAQRSKNRAEFIAKNTQQSLRHEGAAAFINAKTRDEIIANGGPDIEIRGGLDELKTYLPTTRPSDAYGEGLDAARGIPGASNRLLPSVVVGTRTQPSPNKIRTLAEIRARAAAQKGRKR